jgi:hypothetical protein
MLRSEDVGSARLSWVRNCSWVSSPSCPEAFTCSMRSWRARANAVSTADELLRSAPMTMVRPAVGSSSSEEQPAAPAMSRIDAVTDAVAMRGSRTCGAS